MQEDAPIGTHVLTIQAKDGDRGAPRTIVYDLRTSMKSYLFHELLVGYFSLEGYFVVLDSVADPFDYFLLDNNKGELRTAKPLDREAVSNTNGVFSLIVRVSTSGFGPVVRGSRWTH